MKAKPRCAGVEYAPQLRRAAVGLHRVTTAARGNAQALGREQFLRDDLDESLQILWIHGRSSNRRILTSRLMYRASRIGVLNPSPLFTARGQRR